MIRPKGAKHSCNWPGCMRQCTDRHWACEKHWDMLAVKFRKLIHRHYRPGQEQSMDRSEEYDYVYAEICEWIAAGCPEISY